MDPRSFTDLIPLARHLGMEVVAAEPDRVTLRLQWTTNLCTVDGVLHGGALMALGDTAGAICAYLNLPPDAATSTIESKTNFFAAVRRGCVEAVSRPLHVGRSTIVVQTDLVDEQGRAVGQTTQTQSVLRR